LQSKFYREAPFASFRKPALLDRNEFLLSQAEHSLEFGFVVAELHNSFPIGFEKKPYLDVKNFAALCLRNHALARKEHIHADDYLGLFSVYLVNLGGF